MLSIDWSFYYIKSNEYRNMPTINCFDIANFIQLFNLAKPNIIYIFENNSKKKITLTQSIRNSISNKKNRKESIIIDDLYNLQTVDKDDIISSRFYQKLDQREFGFIYNNILFTTSAYNYSCILNLLDGVVSNYFDEKIYLQAKKGKFESIEEYNSLTKQGFKTKQDYNDAIDSNYFNHFDHYKKIYISNIIKYPNFDNVSKLYYFCKNGEFDNYSQFIDAIERGFNNKAEFEKALEDGFDTKKEYDIAQESGFKLKKNFDKANSLGIKSKTIYDIYNNLETKGKLEQFIYSDISFLYYQISLLEDGDKISINRTLDLINEFKESFKKDLIAKKSSTWFKNIINNIDTLKNILMNNPEFNTLGIYDNDGEFFEKLERKNIKIIIDGSNVAWNSNSQKNSDYPELKNISLVVKALKKQNINDITVIIDAALMHKVKDPEFYKEFEDIIHKAPAKIEADYFIIDFARKGSGLIITNDQFKDWKERDSWIQENIDSMLIPFMILNNYVTFGKTFDNSNSLLNKYTKNTNMTTQVITDDNSTSKDKKDILLELFDSHQKKGGLFLKEFERLYIEKFGNSFENFNTFKEFLEFNFKNFEITFKFNKHNLFVKKRVFSKDS